MKRMKNRMAVVGVVLAFLGLMAAGNDVYGAENQKDFFRGKTLLWIYSGGVGDSGDLLTRMIANFLGTELGVKVKVDNKKTDEGVNYMYNQASRDGLTLCTKTIDAIIGNEILKAPGVQYESEKFNYIADIFPSCRVFQISPKLPFRTLDGLRKAKGLRAGATSVKGALATNSSIMFEILGLDGKVITGFGSKKDLTLALARGELDCMVGSDNTAMRDEKDGYIVNLMTTGDKRSVVIPNVPSIAELKVTIPKSMQSAHKFAASGGPAVFLPPGVAPERVESLRRAFHNLSNNKELQKAVEKLTGQWNPFRPGQEVQKEMVEIKADKELAAKLDSLLKKYSAVR